MDQKLVVTGNIYELYIDGQVEAFFQRREFSAGFPKEPLKCSFTNKGEQRFITVRGCNFHIWFLYPSSGQ